MDKHRLASLLRKRQHNMVGANRGLIDSVSDDTIIDCYITCPCCGEKQVDGTRLVSAIARADGVEHFFQICDETSSGRHAHPK